MMYNKKLNLIFVLFLLAIPSINASIIDSGSYLNCLSKGFADTLYCRIGGTCILKNLTVTDVTIINQTTIQNLTILGNVTAENILANIDASYIQNENWVNESFEIGNQTFAQIADGEDIELRLETDVNENAYLYYMESDSGILGFRVWYDGSGGGTYKIDAIDGTGTIIPKLEIDRDDYDIDFFINEDLNDNNITNVGCLELGGTIVCGWSEVNVTTGNSSQDIWNVINNGTFLYINDLGSKNYINVTELDNATIIRNFNLSKLCTNNSNITCSFIGGQLVLAYNGTTSGLWQTQDGEVNLIDKGNINMQGDNITNITKLAFNENVSFKLYPSNEFINGDVLCLEMLGPSGEFLPHWCTQSGGTGQASYWMRSIIITNELPGFFNTTNRTDCQAYMDVINETLKIDCDTATTGADLIVSDDIQIIGDAWFKDTDGEWHFMTRELQVRDEMLNNLVLVGINGTFDFSSNLLNISTITNESIIVNINKTESILNRSTDSISLTPGTNSSPAEIQVFYTNKDDPFLTTASSLSETVPFVATFKLGAGFNFGSSIGGGTVNDFIRKQILRNFDDGLIYKDGFDISASISELNISTGQYKFIGDTIDINQNHSTLDIAVEIHSDGNFHIHNNNLTGFNAYSTGEEISVNKYFNLVCGITNTHDFAGIMYCIIQNKPGTEHTGTIEAETDNSFVNFFPADNYISKIFLPVARIVVQNKPGGNEIQELSNGQFFLDLRGQVSGGGSPPLPSITAHFDLDNLSYDDSGHTGFASQNQLIKNITDLNESVKLWIEDKNYINYTELDNATIIRTANMTSTFLQTILDSVYVKLTSLANYINISQFNSIGNWSKDKPSYINITQLQNSTIFRTENKSSLCKNGTNITSYYDGDACIYNYNGSGGGGGITTANGSLWNTTIDYIFPSDLLKSVGIGVKDPNSELEVQNLVADSWVQTWSKANGNALGGVYETAGGDAYLDFYDAAGNTDVSFNTNGISWIRGGDFGIGTTSPSAKFSIKDETTISMNVSDTLFVDGSNKRVGIGTDNPDSELDVHGNVNISENLYVGENITHPTNRSFGIFNNGSCIVIGNLKYVNDCCDGDC